MWREGGVVSGSQQPPLKGHQGMGGSALLGLEVVLLPAEHAAVGDTHERHKRGLYANSSWSVEETVGLSSSLASLQKKWSPINNPEPYCRLIISTFLWHCAYMHKFTFAQLSISLTFSFSGFTIKANVRFLFVYSWPQNTFCKINWLLICESWNLFQQIFVASCIVPNKYIKTIWPLSCDVTAIWGSYSNYLIYQWWWVVSTARFTVCKSFGQKNIVA